MSTDTIVDSLDIPVAPPPPGVTPDFDNPENKDVELYTAAGICMFLIVAFAIPRIYGTYFVQKKKIWKDWAFVIATLSSLAFISCFIAVMTKGVIGVQMYELTVQKLTVEAMQLTLVLQIFSAPAIWFVKLVLFLLYLEIFRPFAWFRFAVFFGIIVTGLFYSGTTIGFIVLCTPHDGHEQLDYFTAIASPEYIRAHPIVILNGVVNILSDLYLIILPLPAIWGLNMPKSRKIGLSLGFMTGLIAFISSILGTVYRVRFTQEFLTSDYDSFSITIATMVEMAAGTMICCMPGIATVYNHHKKALLPVLSLFSGHTHGLLSRFRSKSDPKTATGEGRDTDSSSSLPSSRAVNLDEKRIKDVEHTAASRWNQ